ncbi:hypothetical protein [Rhizobium sp. SG570]|uniref:hypothetical protein n=1 Tax=Rhizobium sp. SG570 TaxID=2587113 RepID=UPI0014474D70|nr:hypothetical protein [Rhizobium sp. SG570]NKJ38743.1 hypothetical protein [Rhizobium sp. SG570]
MKFDLLGLKFDDLKVLLIFRMWYFTIVATSNIGLLLRQQVHVVSNDFYTSWSVNVLFFTAIGLAAALIGIRAPQNEQFQSRLAFLFAANFGGDTDFREAALRHSAASIKRLGFVNAKIERKVTIEEYNPEYKAYRAFVTVKTSVVNLFGDVEASDVMNFSVSPDPFKGGANVPDVVGQVVSLVMGGKEQIIGAPMDIKRDGGVVFPKDFSVGQETEEFTFKYWCWFEEGEIAYFTPKRYCRHIVITAVNRMRDGGGKLVPVHGFQMPAGGVGEKRELAYGESWQVFELFDAEPDTKQSLFKFLAPTVKSEQPLESPGKSP